MSIDPARLAQQRGLRAVEDRPTYYACPGCGSRTRSKEGRCSPCQAEGMGLSLAHLTEAQLRTVALNARAELQRRRDALDAMIQETA
jgi:predicted ATP-dependent serine protease